MGYAYYTLQDGREAGYSVEAVCDEPGCDAKIDRGVAYLAPGEYALVTLPTVVSQPQVEYITAALPEELHGRVLLIEGTVHTLKPDVTPNSESGPS